MVTHPTVVVGIGQAGINVMSKISDVSEVEGDQNNFKYIAIDSDKDTLNNAPTGTSRITLSLDDDYLKEDVAKYPYLNERMKVKGSGAKRQRPVGRYKLDRRGDGGYDDVFSGLSQEIGAHYESQDVEFGPDTASFNIFLIHSFGGGTGSGSYPLILSMLSKIASDQLSAADEVVYLAGVGVVPQITFEPEIAKPPGQSHDYYPNAYAAMSDLKQFTDLYGQVEKEGDDSLELNLWSKTFSKTGASPEENDMNAYRFTNVPFDDYWLVGVHEGKIHGTSAGQSGPETYAEELNQKMARSIHSISKLDQSAENWASSNPFTGTFEQAEVSIDQEGVESLVEAKDKREQKQNRINADIPNKIEDLEERIRELETIKNDLDPNKHLKDGDLKTEIKSYLENEGFRSGAYIVENKNADDIQAVVDGIKNDYPIEALIVAAEHLQQSLREERGAQAVEAEWKGTIQDLWSRYDMQGKSEYGASGVRTLEGKAGVLEDYLNDQINAFVEMKEEWNPSFIGQLRDMAPPVMEALESDREYAERWLATLQDDHSRLGQAMGEWDRVSKMLEVVDGIRADIRSEIDIKIDETNKQITELQNEGDKLEGQLRRLNNNIADLRSRLTKGQASERLAVVPIKKDRIDDIDKVTLESELTSLLAYVEKGYVSEQKFRYAINQRLNFVEAWDADIVDREYAGTDEMSHFADTNEVWYLYHKENERFVNYIEERPSADENFSGEVGQSKLQYQNDPYVIKYIAYTRRGPLSAFKTFQAYESLEDDDWLTKYADQYDNYLQAFAYLEWYDRDVELAFGVDQVVEVVEPPELQAERVLKPGLTEGELKNYIKTNGLDSYLWQGNMWDNYELGGESFRGWKRALSRNGITFTNLQEATPDSTMKSEWLANQRDWDDIINTYKQNIADQQNTKIIYSEE